ncbi:MAG TPA: hypothetical protein VMT57_02835 [Candidatus Thermoplasmatota archaeon]|nr:hypothetical protein [Candidatus Thermoplasmatota archaeon]
MNRFQELAEQIKILKTARDILKEKYDTSEFHKKKEKFPQTPTPPTPQDGEIYKLLTAIQQLDKYIKELQDEQFKVLKEEEK